MKTKLAVLVSGTGSLLQAMIEDGLAIEVVIADRPCKALEVANAVDLPFRLLERQEASSEFISRREYAQRLLWLLRDYRIDLIAMAGFMTILDGEIIHRYWRKVLNIHPSLLPSFKGANAVQDALAYGVKVTGCTVHIATEEVDKGPILAQEPVRVMSDDTVDTLHERIKQVERCLYPATIREFAKTLI